MLIKFIYFNGCVYKLEFIKDFKFIFFGNLLEFWVNIGLMIVWSDLGF